MKKIPVLIFALLVSQFAFALASRRPKIGPEPECAKRLKHLSADWTNDEERFRRTIDANKNARVIDALAAFDINKYLLEDPATEHWCTINNLNPFLEFAINSPVPKSEFSKYQKKINDISLRYFQIRPAAYPQLIAKEIYLLDFVASDYFRGNLRIYNQANKLLTTARLNQRIFYDDIKSKKYTDSELLRIQENEVNFDYEDLMEFVNRYIGQ